MNEGLLVLPTKADVSIAQEELRLERNSRRDPAHNILTMHNLHNCAIARGGRVMDVRGATSCLAPRLSPRTNPMLPLQHSVLRCTLHHAHCTLYLPCPLHIAHCTLQIAHCPLHIAHCTLHIARCPVHIAHCTLHIAI